MARNKIYRTVASTTCKGHILHNDGERLAKTPFEHVFDGELTREAAQKACEKLHIGTIVNITEFDSVARVYSMPMDAFMAAATLEPTETADNKQEA